MASKSPRNNTTSSSPRHLTGGLFQSLWPFRTKRGTTTKPSCNSALSKPIQLFSKAVMFHQKKKTKNEFENKQEDPGGVWQRNILMGDKCEPLDFSGVIYYDNDGKRLTEQPMRSPRASPLPSYAYKSPRSNW